MKNGFLISVVFVTFLSLLLWAYFYNKTQIFKSYDGRKHLIIQTAKIGSEEAYGFFTCPIKPFQIERCYFGTTHKVAKVFYRTK